MCAKWTLLRKAIALLRQTTYLLSFRAIKNSTNRHTTFTNRELVHILEKPSYRLASGLSVNPRNHLVRISDNTNGADLKEF